MKRGNAATENWMTNMKNVMMETQKMVMAARLNARRNPRKLSAEMAYGKTRNLAMRVRGVRADGIVKIASAKNAGSPIPDAKKKGKIILAILIFPEAAVNAITLSAKRIEKAAKDMW